MKFDENLRELRKEKGYSQEELADRLNVTRQTVSKWENGSAMPDLKKLTELAEFFGVSMDALLGLKVESESKTDSNNSNFEAYIQYADRRIAALEESRNQETKKKIKTLSIIFVIVLFVLIIWLSNYSSNIRNELNNLNYSIQYLQSQMSYYGYSGNDNYWESKINDVTASLLSVDPEKPYIVQMQLKYSPMSYTKGSKVYFSVPKEDKSIEKLEAEEINGEFILTTDIDITIEGEFYFFLDDGDEIVKEELYIYPEDLYCSFGDNYMYFSVYKQNGLTDNKYYFENYPENTELYWSGVASDKLVSAQFIVENAGKVIYTEELETSKSDNSNETVIRLSNYTVEISNINNLKAYVLATDERGIVYKHYIDLEPSFGTESIESPIYYGEYNTIVFDIDGRGKVTVGGPDDITEEVSDIYEN